MRTFKLIFKGYWKSIKYNPIPEEQPGIYCFYLAKKNKRTGQITLRELLYIGQSIDVKDRIRYHEKYDEILDTLDYEETIYFSYAPCHEKNLDRVEAALIFYHEPPFNTELIDVFDYPETIIQCLGKHAYLEDEFKICHD